MDDKREKRLRPMPSWFRESDIDVLEAVRRAAARLEAGVPYPEVFEEHRELVQGNG